MACLIIEFFIVKNQDSLPYELVQTRKNLLLTNENLAPLGKSRVGTAKLLLFCSLFT